jgi:CubicO group peptidase (beta-lactamase class C family)
MPEEKFFADSATEVGLNPDKMQALIDRAERDVKEGVLPSCQVAIACKGKIAAMKTFGLIHTAGIPAAPGSFKDWGDRKRRLERFAQ